MIDEDGPEPDPRWVHFAGGLSPLGQPLPMTYLALRSVSEDWPRGESTPSGVASLLDTARSLYALSWFRYELLAVAASWGLLAVEAALRLRLAASDRTPLAALLKQAISDGLLSAEDIERLDAGRRVRNSFMHADHQQVWTPGMAAGALRRSHRIVSLLYP